MRCRLLVFVAVLGLLVPLAATTAQEKSVRPGINDSFRDPNVEQFVGRFETESREVFARRSEIVKACKFEPGMTVADIGAGTGLFTRLFAEAVGKDGQVVAVDISQKFLDHVQASCREAGLMNVQTVLANADSTELPPESIDAAFICDTYHHFEFPQKTMESLHRALKPGGRVVLIDFRRIPGTSSDWTLNHVRAGQDVFESEIVAAGFQKTSESQDLLQENYFVVFTKGRTAGLKPLVYPIIAGYGGVVPLRDAAEQPAAGAELLLDITADSNPADVNKGLERAARLLNLYGAAGMKSSDVRLAVVLHGEATKGVLNDDFYAARFNVERNPNMALLRELRKAGVEIFVCGQALNYKGFAESAVAEEATVAAAALTVILNRQAAGYTVIAVP